MINEIINNVTIEEVLRHYRFGFATTYDGDSNKVLYSTTCNCCGRPFYSERIDIYCKRCKEL